MNALTTIPVDEISPDLSEQEQLFLYNLEVLGMPVARAAEVAGGQNVLDGDFYRVVSANDGSDES